MENITIQLAEGYYRIKNRIVERWTCIERAEWNDEIQEYVSKDKYDWCPTKFEVGARAMLVSYTDVSPDATRRGVVEKFCLEFTTNGIEGNTNPPVKRFHGWRGTINDSFCCAYGLREIKKLRTLQSGLVGITVGPDIYPKKP